MNYAYTLALIVSTSVCASQNLWIENTTSSKVNLAFSVNGAPLVKLPVFAGKKQVIVDPENITALYLERTGWSSIVSTKENLADELKLALRKHSARDVSLKVELFGSSFAVYIPALFEPLTSVLGYFPEVVQAIREQRRLWPEYFLGLREDASKEQIERSYQGQSVYLKSLIEGDLPKSAMQTAYYVRILLFVQAAYNSIRDGDEAPLRDLLIDERGAIRARQEAEEEEASQKRILRMRELAKELGFTYDPNEPELAERNRTGGRRFDRFSRGQMP
jgi:hypothetical protein